MTRFPAESETPSATERDRLPASRYVCFAVVLIGGVVADLTTKAWIFARLGMPGEKPVWWIIEGVFGFQTSLNEGALFGMGQGMTAVFALVAVVMAVGLPLWLFWGKAARDWRLAAAGGAVTAGILGNLYDRLGFPGLVWNYPSQLHQVGEPVYAVRDWILVMIGSWPWPNFNIADSLLVCGVAVICLHALLVGESEDEASCKTKVAAENEQTRPVVAEKSTR
ncbi:signal peptidase II [Thermostilla marina]